MAQPRARPRRSIARPFRRGAVAQLRSLCGDHRRDTQGATADQHCGCELLTTDSLGATARAQPPPPLRRPPPAAAARPAALPHPAAAPPPPTPPASARAAPSQAPATTSATASIDVDSRDLPVIPQSFMGLSHEWPYVEEMATQPKYMDMLNYLTSFGSGPLSIRVGGGSTDIQNFVPAKAVRAWEWGAEA